MLYNNVKAAPTPRGELSLPHMHYVLVDDWEPKIGEKAIFKWFKLITMADRSNPDRKFDKVPRPLADLTKEWKIGKTTLYNQIIKPLWNHGLIDLEEYEAEGKKGSKAQKPVNIIVYKAPLNDTGLLSKPLQKVRDYDKDYHSEARINALKKNAVLKEDGGTVPEQDGHYNADLDPLPFKNVDFNTVLEQDGGPSQNRTGDRPEIGQNNYLKSFINSFKSFNKEDEEEKEYIHARAEQVFKQLANYQIDQFTSLGIIERLIELKVITQITEGIIIKAMDKVNAYAADPTSKHIGHPAHFIAQYIQTEATRYKLAANGYDAQEKKAAATEKQRQYKRPDYNYLEN